MIINGLKKENNTKKFIHLSGRNEYNTPYMKTLKDGIVQRFVSTIELFHGDHNAMQSYTLRSESDFFWAQRWTQDKRVQDKRVSR